MAQTKRKQDSILTRVHVPAKDREFFAANLADLLNAAVPVGEAITSLEETTNSKGFKKVLTRLRRDIDDGIALSQALEYSGLVSRQTLTLVQPGEQSGKLVENLAIAAKQEQKQRLFHAKLRSAMIYPVFVLGVTVIVGLAVAWFLLPKLSDTFNSLNVTLPLISRIMINVGLFLKDNGVWAVPGIIAVLVAIMLVLFVLPQTRSLGLRLSLHMPGIGKLAREVEIARFGYLLGTLLDAGLPITRAVPMLERSTEMPAYKAFYRYLGESFNDGYGFKESFKQYKHSTKLTPPAVQQMIVAGERSGSLPHTLSSVGERYDEKVDVTTKNFEAIIEPVLLVFVWLGVMAVAVAVILPIYSLVGGING